MRNKSFLVAVVALLLLPTSLFAAITWTGNSTSWTKGTGTESDPYQIETPEQLAFLTEMVRLEVSNYQGIYFLQTEDFDLNKVLFTPIGSGTTVFKGNYDGGNHYVANLYLNAENNDYLALFGKVEGSKISNITVKGSHTSSAEKQYKAGLVAYATNMTLTHCKNEANVKNTYSSTRYTGGMVGYGNGTVTLTDCSNIGSISSSNSYDYYSISYSGGMVGQGDGTITITDCSNIGSISSSSSYSNSYSGGMVGYGNGTITDCSNTGSISSSSSPSSSSYYSYSGGMVGYGNSTVTITDCSNSGSISSSNPNSSSYSGGMVGWGYGTFKHCINEGKFANTPTYGGGIIGQVYSHRSILDYCENKQNISANNAGGLVGYTSSTITITNSTNTGAVTGIEKAGGMVGYGLVAISYCNNKGTISTNGSAVAYAGGLLGQGHGSISNSSCAAEIKGASSGNPSTAYAAGLVGGADGSKLIISLCSYVGTVTSTVGTTSYAYAAGLVGINTGDASKCLISNCYARGPLTCSGKYQNAYGLGRNCAVFNSYFAGTLSATTLSYSLTDGSVSNGYYNTDCGATQLQGTAKTEAEFKAADMPGLLNGASSEVWEQDTKSVNAGYPVLTASESEIPTAHTIKVTCDAKQGTVSGGGYLAEGTYTTISATANTGFAFTQWADGNSDNPRKVFVGTADATYTAQFRQSSFAITVRQDCTSTVK